MKILAKRLTKDYACTMRINRQELLKSLIGLNLIELGANVDASLRRKLTNDYTDEITRQAGILGEFKHPIWTSKEVLISVSVFGPIRMH